jgi:hypothetical protein
LVQITKQMAAIVVETRNRSELKLVRDMLKKMNIPSKLLTESEREDVAFGLLVLEADRSKKVSREKIMKKLSR